MNRVLMSAFAALFVTASATSAMAFSDQPRHTNMKLGELSPWQVQARSSTPRQSVSVPVTGATGFTQQFGNQPRRTMHMKLGVPRLN